MNKDVKILESKTLVKSLCWNNENLIDLASGGNVYQLDGATHTSNMYFPYSFDAAIMSPSRRYYVVYERLGTKGLILEHNKVVREINRSYYHAQVYEYPIALFQLPDGREVIAHCPQEYNKLEIEDLETGKRLTERNNETWDFFHSRLASSDDGKYLLSAGWIWHPVDWIVVYDIEAVLQNPALLDDEPQPFGGASMDINNACFFGDNQLVVHSSKNGDDFFDDEPEERPLPLQLGSVGLFDLQIQKWRHISSTTAELGTMFALDDKHVLSVYDHPKVVNIETGKIVQEWSDLKTGQQNSSIIHHIEKPPPMAFDKMTRRFAVANEKTIQVLTIPHYN